MSHFLVITLVLINFLFWPTYAAESQGVGKAEKDLIFVAGESECPICYENYKALTPVGIFPCGHIACIGCARNMQANYCPICRQSYKPENLFQTTWENVAEHNVSMLFSWYLLLGHEHSVLELFNKLRAESSDNFLAIINGPVDDKKRTLFHYAASKGWTKLIIALIEVQADLNLQDEDLKTPYDLAKELKRVEVSKILESLMHPGPEGQMLPIKQRPFFSWEADKKTWNCHWFPISERRAGGDPMSNLFAPNGALDKFDRFSGSFTRNYEWEHHRKFISAFSQFNWWGYQTEAAQVACILEEPKQTVSMTGLDGTEIKFTPIDIQGLLVKIIGNLVSNFDFRDADCAPTQGKPKDFLRFIENWSKDRRPFVIDVGGDDISWNYPFDKVSIVESEQPPCDGADLKHYDVEFSGTGHEYKTKNFKYYIQKHGDGRIDCDWIGSSFNFRSIFRPIPVADLKNRENWRLRRNTNAPNVDPQIVYDIYMKSIMK